MPTKERLNDTTAELAYRASRDDVDERNDLWCVNYRKSITWRRRIESGWPKHVDLEDLVQAGVIGLL